MEDLYPYYSAHLINTNSNLLVFRIEHNEITIRFNKDLIL